MRVALVHDYLNQMGGAERVLLALHTLFPDAPIYTTIYDPPRMDPAFRAMDIRTSFMQRLPFVKRHHQPFLPLYPFAIEHMDLREYDLVISDSSAFAKGVVTRSDALHICYCHTPMRWAWNFEDYVERERIGRFPRAALAPLIVWLRQWDYTTAARVDEFIANSANVAARIARYYRREATILPPPVETSRYTVASTRGQYFLVVSRLIPYKRIDLAVKAFTMLGLPLRIIGTGRDEAALRRLAGPSVQFLGWLPDEEVRAQMAGCRALIFPGEEDFGLVPVEAQACGRPVIAYGAGGALASMVEGATGLFFHEQTPEALAAAVLRFRDEQFDARVIRQHAEAFDTTRFLERFQRFVATRITEHHTLSDREDAGIWAPAGDEARPDASSSLADSSSSAGQ
ncbi:MAG TPA: glycosyltransferase [Ktedonobacterales bacterium]